MRWSTVYDGSQYDFIERPTRACILRDGEVVWWGDIRDKIPVNAGVPLVVLLTFSAAKGATD